MKKIFYLLLIILLAGTAWGQTTTQDAQVQAPPPPPAEQKVNVYGFVRNDVYLNSRKNLDLRDGVLDVYPLDQSLTNSYDANKVAQLGFSSIVTRFGVKFGGIKAFGANVSGVLETDFFGITNGTSVGLGTENLLRLRHAYAQLDWKNEEKKTNSALLMGQYWNPNFVAKCFPGTANFNTGIPINPFGFVPQIRYTRTWNKISLMGMAYGYDLGGFSPSIAATSAVGSGVDAFRIATMPALASQLTYESGKLLVIAGVEYNTIQPNVTYSNGTRIASNFTATNFMALAKYTGSSFTLKGYVNSGQLFTQYVGLGGFVGYQEGNAATGNFKYEGLKQINTWFEGILTKSKTIQPALFAI